MLTSLRRLYLSTGARLARHRITQAHPADTAATSQPSALVTLVSAGNRLDTEKPTTAITPRASRNELSAYIRDSKTTIRAITARETPVSTSNAKSRLRLKEPIKIMVAAPIVVVRSAGDRITQPTRVGTGTGTHARCYRVRYCGENSGQPYRYQNGG